MKRILLTTFFLFSCFYAQARHIPVSSLAPETHIGHFCENCSNMHLEKTLYLVETQQGYILFLAEKSCQSLYPLGYVDGMSLYGGYFGEMFWIDPYGLHPMPEDMSGTQLQKAGILPKNVTKATSITDITNNPKYKGKIIHYTKSGIYEMEQDDFYDGLPSDIKDQYKSLEYFHKGCVGITCLLNGYNNTYEEINEMTQDCFTSEDAAIKFSMTLDCCKDGKDRRAQVFGIALHTDLITNKNHKLVIKGDRVSNVERAIQASQAGIGNSPKDIPFDFGWKMDDGHYITADRAHQPQKGKKMTVYIKPSKEFFDKSVKKRYFETAIWCVTCRRKAKYEK